jgi:hypothetical protein
LSVVVRKKQCPERVQGITLLLKKTNWRRKKDLEIIFQVCDGERRRKEEK